jgi:ornithine cyclodeaminase/alanine dehydrogenase-like protein (mu-crystallin family)
LAAALLAAHRGDEPLVDRSELHAVGPRGERQTWFTLPAFLPGIAMGAKLVSVMPANPRLFPQTPTVQAVYVLFDGTDGSPAAVIDATAMTYRKTAADSALGSDLLSRADSRVLLMVGAGGLAPYLIAAHCALRPSICEIMVWARRIDRAVALATAVGGRAVASLESAVRRADIISCATASTAPLVMGAWLKPGAHLDLVGAFSGDMRECDDAAVMRSRLFVDSRVFAIDQPGDLGDPIRRGIIPRDQVEADLFDLARGYAPRRQPGDITLYKNGGGGHLDLFTALFIISARKGVYGRG